MVSILAVLMLVSCTGGISSGETYVWLDVPVDGLTLAEVQAVKIEGHATSPGGISRVEILADGALVTTLDNPATEGVLASFKAEWTAPGPGEYTLQAVAYGANGLASQPDVAHIRFGGALPEEMPSSTPTIALPTDIPPATEVPSPIPTPTSTITASPTPTSIATPVPLVQFWAEPPEIEAGACTAVRWHVENVRQVIFGGSPQPFDGAYKDCLCANERYTLTVIYTDGTEEKFPVDISVHGACITPTPVDTTPPAAPAPAVPANGLSMACKASQSLVWLPVTDESGIAAYQVQVQRSMDSAKWNDAPGSPLSVSDKTTTIPVECGWIYRWRVQATDGAGNVGPWSEWSLFSIPLG
jgi:hypothetical protein